MAASVHLGYSIVALSGNELGFIGSIIGGISTIVAAVMANAAAARRQQRELRYQRKGSGMTGFLLALLLISIAAGVYFANRPAQVKTAQASDPPPAAAPITLEEASAIVSTYLENVDADETVNQAWDMFTDVYQSKKAATESGKDGFRSFWRSVDTVRATGELSVIEGPTATRVVVQVPVKFNMIPALISPGKSPCSTENDDFTIVRINGVLQIDRARISPGSFGTC
ncbi:MAG: hypothetical protein ABI706_13595 [Ilumatobacteraceae bacterium]